MSICISLYLLAIHSMRTFSDLLSRIWNQLIVYWNMLLTGLQNSSWYTVLHYNSIK